MPKQTILSRLEKEEIVDLLAIETENAFDRVLNQYSNSDQTKYAQFLWELEAHLKKSLRAHHIST